MLLLFNAVHKVNLLPNDLPCVTCIKQHPIILSTTHWMKKNPVICTSQLWDIQLFVHPRSNSLVHQNWSYNWNLISYNVEFLTADEEMSAVVKKERLFEVKNPMKQATSLRALKRKHTKESDSSDESSSGAESNAVTSSYKSKR